MRLLLADQPVEALLEIRQLGINGLDLAGGILDGHAAGEGTGRLAFRHPVLAEAVGVEDGARKGHDGDAPGQGRGHLLQSLGEEDALQQGSGGGGEGFGHLEMVGERRQALRCRWSGLVLYGGRLGGDQACRGGAAAGDQAAQHLGGITGTAQHDGVDQARTASGRAEAVRPELRRQRAQHHAGIELKGILA